MISAIFLTKIITKNYLAKEFNFRLFKYQMLKMFHKIITAKMSNSTLVYVTGTVRFQPIIYNIM